MKIPGQMTTILNFRQTIGGAPSKSRRQCAEPKISAAAHTTTVQWYIRPYPWKLLWVEYMWRALLHGSLLLTKLRDPHFCVIICAIVRLGLTSLMWRHRQSTRKCDASHWARCRDRSCKRKPYKTRWNWNYQWNDHFRSNTTCTVRVKYTYRPIKCKH